MVTKKDEPIFKLPAEMKSRLDTANTDIEKAQKAIDVMKSLGMDVTEMQDKLNWAKQVRTTLIKEFG
jgi:hypothetical protein